MLADNGRSITSSKSRRPGDPPSFAIGGADAALRGSRESRASASPIRQPGSLAILEIGAGSGANLRRYPPAVREVVALEPDPTLIRMARNESSKSPRSVSFLEASAEQIPFDDASFDTVVSTWTMCTIPDVRRALEEMRRVLKPGGRLLFVEHGLSADSPVRRWQNRLDPLWSRVSGGCHINRPIESFITAAGLAIDQLQTGYMAGPRVMTFIYEGAAHRH